MTNSQNITFACSVDANDQLSIKLDGDLVNQDQSTQDVIKKWIGYSLGATYDTVKQLAPDGVGKIFATGQIWIVSVNYDYMVNLKAEQSAHGDQGLRDNAVAFAQTFVGTTIGITTNATTTVLTKNLAVGISVGIATQEAYEHKFFNDGTESAKDKIGDYVRGLFSDSSSSQVAVENEQEDQSSVVDTYTIQSGDTISNLAETFGVTREELVAANPWLETDGRISSDGKYALIKSGETLNIPTLSDQTSSAVDTDSDFFKSITSNLANLTVSSGELINIASLLSTENANKLLTSVKESLNGFVSDSHTISDHFQSYLDSFRSAETVVERRVDPLTLDLDGDGVELVNVAQSTAFFDLDVTADRDANGNLTGTYTSDGVKEQVGWVSGDDGLLALDKNNNGAIDNILELFGKNNKTGTEELREYDLNNDGKIDSKDAIFSQLKVWQDVNQDGISQASELKSLTDLKITSINVAADSLTQINQTNNGNVITSKGSFTQSVTSTVVNADGTTSEVTSGVTKTYANLDLAVNQTNSVAYTYTDSEGNTIGNYNLNLDVLSAPMIRGYGNVDALPVAESKNQYFMN